MKQRKGRKNSQAVTIVIFALAVGLLLFSSIGGARAALNYYSEVYASRVETQDIGVTLVENGVEISNRDYNYDKAGETADGSWNENIGILLGGMLDKGEKLKLGWPYEEKLSVRNSGTIPQYVRVSIYKYWLDQNGTKLPELSPELIDLKLVEDEWTDGGRWILDEDASTRERTVLYYSKKLGAEADSGPFADTLTIDRSITGKVTQNVKTERNQKTITTVYDYDGIEFCVDVKVDAVQDHNAEDAIWSEWGRRVRVNDDTLSLN